mmetsp:Transcript_28310/g.72513  ORF Transcript_28310/g.72513 Transcript_28310/m.72513 type:complete len:291 (+) Transcript_28310:217-1089(+)
MRVTCKRQKRSERRTSRGMHARSPRVLRRRTLTYTKDGAQATGWLGCLLHGRALHCQRRCFPYARPGLYGESRPSPAAPEAVGARREVSECRRQVASRTRGPPAAHSRCAPFFSLESPRWWGTQYRLVFFMIRKNSSSLISPSPSRSASSIISCNSSSVIFSPSSLATRFRFLKEILPVSSSSKRRNALRISSLLSFSLILAVIICRNSSKSIVPEPSLSMSAIIFLISSFLGSKPSARIATFSSLASIEPLPSVSKRSNASRISCFCSSVSSALPPFLPALGGIVSSDW